MKIYVHRPSISIRDFVDKTFDLVAGGGALYPHGDQKLLSTRSWSLAEGGRRTSWTCGFKRDGGVLPLTRRGEVGGSMEKRL